MKICLPLITLLLRTFAPVIVCENQSLATERTYRHILACFWATHFAQLRNRPTTNTVLRVTAYNGLCLTGRTYEHFTFGNLTENFGGKNADSGHGVSRGHSLRICELLYV